jgi:hypothetical protein
LASHLARLTIKAAKKTVLLPMKATCPNSGNRQSDQAGSVFLQSAGRPYETELAQEGNIRAEHGTFAVFHGFTDCSVVARTTRRSTSGERGVLAKIEMVEDEIQHSSDHACRRGGNVSA